MYFWTVETPPGVGLCSGAATDAGVGAGLDTCGSSVAGVGFGTKLYAMWRIAGCASSTCQSKDCSCKFGAAQPRALIQPCWRASLKNVEPESLTLISDILMTSPAETEPFGMEFLSRQHKKIV